MNDAFKLLGLPDTATPEQVRKAYRQKAAELHPDKGGDPKEFILINAAYKYAQVVSKEPVECDKCGGVGYNEREIGWRVSRTVCACCGGQGTIPR